MNLSNSILHQLRGFSKAASAIDQTLIRIETNEFELDDIIELSERIAILEEKIEGIIFAVSSEESKRDVRTLTDVSNVLREIASETQLRTQRQHAKSLFKEISEKMERVACDLGAELMAESCRRLMSLHELVEGSSPQEAALRELVNELEPYSELIALIERKDELDDEELVERAESLKEIFGKTIYAKLVTRKLFLDFDTHNPLTTKELAHSSQEEPTESFSVSPKEDKSKKDHETSSTRSNTEPEIISKSSKTDEMDKYKDLILHFLSEGRYGLAYNAAAALERLDYTDFEGFIFSNLLKALTIGSEIRHVNSPLINELEPLLSTVQSTIEETEEKTKKHIYRLIFTASIVRPLIVSTTLFQSISVELLCGCNPCLLQSLSELAAFPISDELLSNFTDRKHRLEESKKISERASKWFRTTQNSSKSYGETTKILKKSLKKGGILQVLLQPVMLDRSSQLEAVQKGLYSLGDEADVIEFIRKEMKNDTGKTIRENLVPDELVRKFIDAKSFAKDWVDHHKENARPGNQDPVLKILEELEAHVIESLIDLETSITECKSPAEKTSKQVLIGVLTGIKEWLSSSVSLPERTADLSLNFDLLYTSLPLGTEWSPSEEDSASILEELSILKESFPSSCEAFQRRLEFMDLKGAKVLYEYGSKSSKEGFDRISLGRDIALNSKKAEEDFQESLQKLTNELENTLISMKIDPSDRDYLTEKLREARNAVSQELFYFAKVTFNKIESKLERIVEKASNEIIASLEESGIDKSSPEFLMIEERLSKMDLATAVEYRDKYLKNEPLEIPLFSNPILESFFPDKAKQINEYLLANTNFQQVLKALIEDPKKLFGNIEKENEQLVRENLDLLQIWNDTEYRKVFESDSLAHLFSGLGFQEVEVAVSGNNKAHLKCRKIEDRNICPIPSFGSFAEGNYTIYGLWKDTSPGNIVEKVGETSSETSPTIVLCFGKLDNIQRIELSKLSRARQRTFIVIDEILMVFLLSCSPRLSALFSCSLPFTLVQPYTRSGELPPEMFFGRQSEMNSLLKGNGTSFVYGGRQLGKTALLHAVKRKFNNPAKGRYAIYVDLEAYKTSIGIDYRDDFWRIISESFNMGGPVKLNPGSSIKGQLNNKLIQWINRDPGNRLVLLLDEADSFLENDAHNTDQFELTLFLKGLMQKTNNRFKVIFAGLHNVARTMQYCNQPLAHFGEPMCVSAMQNSGDWQEAKALIEIPLSANGFIFQSSALSSRILSKCIYYPSLIQTFCGRLLRTLNSYAIDNVPRVITSEDIDSVINDKSINDALLSSFELTLQLDKRYELLAYIAAYEVVSKSTELSKGVSKARILQNAKEFCPKLMENISVDEITPLLNEMIGLGILKQVSGSDEYFTLRNENVLPLLGSKSQIDDKLLSFYDLEITDSLDPATFRAFYPENKKNIAPLTFSQVQLIREKKNNISVFFGTEAAGIEEIPEFLTYSFQRESVEIITTNDVATFRIRVADALKLSDHKGIPFYIVIPSSVPWSAKWIEEAESILRKKERYSDLHSVFLGDYSHALSLHEENQIESLREIGIVISTLQPICPSVVERWLSSMGIVDFIKFSEMLEARTGFWSRPFHFLASVKSKRGDAVERRLLEIQKTPFADLFDETNLERMFELERSQTKTVLATILKNKALDLSHLSELQSGNPLPDAEFIKHLSACELIGFLRPRGENSWIVDEFVSKIVLDGDIGE